MITFNRFKFFFTLFFLCSLLGITAKTIIWDCGGVLFNQDQLGLIRHEIGIKRLFWYLFLDQKNPKKLKKLTFTVLEQIPTSSSMPLYDHHGTKLPAIFDDWFTGKIDSKKILDYAFQLIDSPDYAYLFVSEREQELIKTIITSIFDPNTLATYMQPISQAKDLLAECCKDPSCTLLILSNWDSASFDCLYNSAHGQEIFQFFDPENIVISGDCGLSKPNKKIYTYILKKYHLKAKDCIFIDDQAENISAARQCGIQGYWLKDGNYKKLHKKLIKKGFLHPTPNLFF